MRCKRPLLGSGGDSAGCGGWREMRSSRGVGFQARAVGGCELEYLRTVYGTVCISGLVADRIGDLGMVHVHESLPLRNSEAM